MLRAAGRRERQAIDQHRENDQGDENVSAVALPGKSDERQRYPRHRSGDQQQQPELNYGLGAGMRQGLHERASGAQFGGLAPELSIGRRGLAALRQPPYASGNHNHGGEQDPRPKQRSDHLFEPFVSHRTPPENPL